MSTASLLTHCFIAQLLVFWAGIAFGVFLMLALSKPPEDE